MPRKTSLNNLAASITGATVALSKTDANTAVITFITLDVHNLYPGAKVITTGLTSSDGNFNPNLVSQLVYKIDSPTSFSANVPWTYTTVPTISLTGGAGVYGTMYSSNGALNAVAPKYGLPVVIPRPQFYNYTFPTLTAVGWGTGVKLNWTAIGIANPEVTSVKVERLVNGAVVATVSTSATGVNVIDPSLASTGVANPFTYRVTALNTVQANIISETVDTLWLGSLGTALAVPTQNASSRITISWPTPTSGNASITNLELERATNSGFTVGAITLSTALSASATSYTDTTVATNSSYFYRVRSRADYAGATSVYSVYSTTAASGNPYYITAPASITVSPTASTANQISVSWSAVSTTNPNISSYTLQEAYSSNGGSSFSAWELATSTSGTTYTKTSATSGYQYKYQVQANNGQLISAFTTSTATAPYYLADPLTAPGVTTSATTNSNLIVSGSYNANPSALTYNIRRSSDGGSTWSNVGVTDFTITLPYTDTTTASGVSYVYAVKAKNAQLTNSNWSATSASRLTYNVPTFPTGVGAAPVSYNTVSLGWTAGTVNSTATPIIDYKIERATNSGFTVNATTLSTTTTGTAYSDSTASGATTYYYRISARNGIGYSPVSSVVVATTPAQTINTTLNVSAISTVTYPTGATVSGSISPNPAGGTVAITEGGAPRATATVSAAGNYSATLPTANSGGHNLALSYSGNGIYQPSTATASYTVNAASSSITISGPTNTYYTDTQAFSATVSPAISGRSVTFYRAGSPVATSTTNSSGVATYNRVTSTTESSISWTASVASDNYVSASSSAKVSSVVAMPLYINATISGATDGGFYVGTDATGPTATTKSIAMSATATDNNGTAVAITPTYKYKQFGGSPTTWSGASTSRNQSTLFYATATKAGYTVQDQSGYGNGSNVLYVYIAQEQTASASALGDYAGPSGTVFGNNARYSTTSMHQGYFSSNQGDYQSLAWFSGINWNSVYNAVSPTANAYDGIIVANLTITRLAGVGDSAARALWIGAHADTSASAPASYTSITAKSINLDKTHTMATNTTTTFALNASIRSYFWSNASVKGGVTFGRQGVSSVQSGTNNIYMELDNPTLNVVWYADPNV
jgi:hypothetical protein